MSSPVDVPGRSLPAQDALSASPNNESFIDFSHIGTDNMAYAMNNTLNKPDCLFPLIPGEVLEEVAQFPGSRIFLTNFRFIILYDPSRFPIKVESIALGNIDAIDSNQSSDVLNILCKDARVIRVQTCNLEQSVQWYKKLTALALPRPTPSLFALRFSRAVHEVKEGVKWVMEPAKPEYVQDEQALFDRWKMDPEHFSVVDYNADFNICTSYPRHLIIPKEMTKRDIEKLGAYRMLGRIPAVSWHCPKKKVLLLRASQPRPAIMNWRSDQDESFLRYVTEYTKAKTKVEGQIKIFDCRSYLATLGNRMKGGGSEREEHYTNMKLEYCNLPNIHNVRYMFDALRKLFTPPVEQSEFLASLQATNWLGTIMSILHYSNRAAEQLENGTNVLIHCSDGWDRTTQLISLVKILVDPYYRTIAGLEEIIRRDWIGFGHKFNDRSGVTGTDGHEKCPIFLQWLDAVRQIHVQHSTRFEYSMAYLVKLAQHHSSGLFTSFCFNSVKEMEEALEAEKCPPLPIWRMLNSDKSCVNALYERVEGRLTAPESMPNISLWNEVYRCQDVASLLTTKQSEEAKKDAAAAAGGGTGGEGVGEVPARRNTQASTSEMDRSMIKSRSQDSLASTSESQPAGAVLRATESDEEADTRERRNTRTSSGSLEATVAAITASVVNGVTGGNVSSQSTPDSSAAIAAAAAVAAQLLDNDGLVRFIDPPQECARKKFEKLSESCKEETERQRMRSEMSDVSIGRGGDDETFQMDDLTDTSVVDEQEFNDAPRNYGTQVHATHCSVCNHRISMLSKMNCNSCGRAVCTKCCSNKYMEPSDGVAKTRRACNQCYSKMSTTPMPLTPSSSSSSTHHRSCPDGEATPQGTYVSPSQAVRG